MPKQNRKRKSVSSIDELNRKQKMKFLDGDDEHTSEILFGGSEAFLKCLEEVERESSSANANVDSGLGEEDSDDCDIKSRLPAWTDDDDEIDVGEALDVQGRKLPRGGINERTNKYSNLLKQKFISIVGNPSWADLDAKNENSDSDDEILQTSGFLKNPKSETLPGGSIEYKKVLDLNAETYSEGPYVTSVEFLKTSTVALVSGNNGVGSLYAVDGKRNNKLHTFEFQNYSILSSKIILNGSEAILGSRFPYIYKFDLMSSKLTRIQLPSGLTQFKNFIVSPDQSLLAAAGTCGEVHLLSSKSKERIKILKQCSNVTSLCFDASGKHLYGHSDTGEITVWDVSSRKVVHKFTDEGCIQGSAITVSPSNQFLATASLQGVVNLYDYRDVLKNNLPKPTKSIFNLTTGINKIAFNSSSEILGYSSPDIKNSMKLYHLGSGTTFQNFPSFGAKFGNVNTFDFSPNSGYLAIGNRKSTVLLYRLKHYSSY